MKGLNLMSFNSGIRNSPASEKEIKEIEKSLKLEIPDVYRQFLLKTNGMVYDLCVLYGTDDIVDSYINNQLAEYAFQIEVSFDERFMYGRILSQNPVNTEYTVFNSSVSYIKQDGRLFQIAHVCRAEKDKKSDIQVSKELYINRCEIGYELPDNTKYEERGV